MGPTPIKNIENYKAMIGEGSHETRNFNLHLTIAPTTQKKNSLFPLASLTIKSHTQNDIYGMEMDICREARKENFF